MKIRKISYSINYIHIITFNQYYRKIIAPYFSYENLAYGIDNEITINEGARLVFKNEGVLINLKKENITFVYEGDISDVKRAHPILDYFFSIYEKIKSIDEFKKTVRHEIIIDAVEILDGADYEKYLKNNHFLKNPFGKLDEYGCSLEFVQDAQTIKMQAGNYTDKDIKKYDLTPYETEYNKDLFKGVGLMCRLVLKENIQSSSFSAFKNLLKDGETFISKYYE